MLKRKNVDMLSGPVMGKILLYSLPIMISGILQLLYNAADVIVVGRFCGKESMAAVGSTTSLVHLLINLLLGLSTGAKVIIAQNYGAGDKRAIKESSHTSVLLAIISGFIMGVIGFLFSRSFLELMGSPEDVIDLSALYLKIYFLGVPAAMLLNFGTSILGAAGDTKRPLYIISVSGLINVILNLIFVVFIHMDVAGVALATIISQYLSAFAILYLLIKTDEAHKITLRSLKIHKDKLKKIFAIGIPAGIQSCTFSLSNVIIQSSINAFGSTILAGSTAANNIEGFVYTAMNSISQATLTFTGQNIGARKPERIIKIWRSSIILSAGIGIFLGGLLYIFSTPLLSLYSTDLKVIYWGKERILCIALFYFLCGFMEVNANTLRGLGRSIAPMIISIIGVCGTRILWIAGAKAIGLINPSIGESIAWIYVSYPVSWIITGLVQMGCFIYVKNTYLKRRLS